MTYARVSTFEGPASRIDAFLEDASGTVERIRELPGFSGIDLLVNRETGKILSITQWESLEAVESTDQVAREMRSEGVDPARGDQPPSFEVFEYALRQGAAPS